MRELTVSFLLLLAAYGDFKKHRVANGLIIAGWSLGCAYRLWSGGLSSLGYGALSVLVLILIGWPLYHIGGVGAGDIKLCSIISIFYGLHFFGKVLVIMSAIAGMLSLLQLWRRAELKQRCSSLLVYILDRRYRSEKYYRFVPGERGRVIPLAPITWISYELVLLCGKGGI